MNVKCGSKIITRKNMGMLKEGIVCTVTDVDENNTISFECHLGMGMASEDEFDKYFAVYEEPKKAIKNTVTEEEIDAIMDASEYDAYTVFDKCTVVSVKLPNGFVITESSACVSPENYDEQVSIDICMKKIKDKIWELEGYKLQCELHNSNRCDDCKCPYDCNGCPYEDDENDYISHCDEEEYMEDICDDENEDEWDWTDVEEGEVEFVDCDSCPNRFNCDEYNNDYSGKWGYKS